MMDVHAIKVLRVWLIIRHKISVLSGLHYKLFCVKSAHEYLEFCIVLGI